MSQNTLRQLMILGIGALFVLMLVIYKKSGVNGWQAVPFGRNVKDVSETAEAIVRETETAKAGTEADPTRQEQTAGDGKGEIQVDVQKENPKVRVLICGDDYQGESHGKVTLQCTTDYTVSYGDVTEEHKASETVWLTPEDEWLEKGAVTLTPQEKAGLFTWTDLKRSQENPAYGGKFIIEKTEEGLRVINEVPLETYLRSVVPGEMPADYPLEALKAQAICARTYALKHLAGSREAAQGADLDDSVSYQVYNNIGRSRRTDRAVRETRGQVLTRGGELIDALYYSTSCGLDLSRKLSDEAVFCAFMTGQEKSCEREEPWYRWSTYFSLEEIGERVQEGREEAIGAVKEMTVEERKDSGVIEKLEIRGEGGSLLAEGEYQIRKLLVPKGMPVTLQDGSTAPDLGMLPSAFFYLTPEYQGEKLAGYTLTGGGYGHGQGLSQNGARHMAEAGYACKDILRHYYGAAGQP